MMAVDELGHKSIKGYEHPVPVYVIRSRPELAAALYDLHQPGNTGEDGMDRHHAGV
jgi:hypothetical protein